MRSHEWIDARSLALDRAIAEKLSAKPDLLGRARRTLERWLEQRQPAVPSVLLEWHEILTGWPLGRILDLLTSPEETPRRLRQSSPFCGILSPQERLAILKEYESRRPPQAADEFEDAVAHNGDKQAGLGQRFRDEVDQTQ